MHEQVSTVCFCPQVKTRKRNVIDRYRCEAAIDQQNPNDRFGRAADIRGSQPDSPNRVDSGQRPVTSY
jgi:SUMO ligase MMS21 Smc5/6 complex component